MAKAEIQDYPAEEMLQRWCDQPQRDQRPCPPQPSKAVHCHGAPALLGSMDGGEEGCATREKGTVQVKPADAMLLGVIEPYHCCKVLNDHVSEHVSNPGFRKLMCKRITLVRCVSG